jgi:fructuronate reductase
VRAVFGDDLPDHPGFRAAVTRALDTLIRRGAKATAAAYAEPGGPPPAA